MIHSTAIIDPSAKVDPTAEIGPYVIVGPDVTIGAGVKIQAHATVESHTDIGDGTVIFSHAAVGGAPQDLKYAGEPTRLTLGKKNIIREYATLNRGTPGGGGATTVGDGNLIMAYVHIAHDCRIGNGVIFANGAQLAGHVTIEDHARLGGFVAVHQFCRIGALAMIGAVSPVGSDVPPFTLCAGPRDRSGLYGLNVIGLRRSGVSRDAIGALKAAYKRIFMERGGDLSDALTDAETEFGQVPQVARMIEFIRSSKRGVYRHIASEEESRAEGAEF
ncbi:MAG: acyl-ACP--UDP-N-acetylglucosamine O-acyltransferase [Candidatus Methylomirabilis sp.]|nr:acyl-ACP--UDP-N-acetylglucosamine O-acyltransferase [Deltaproteobacteria bacterium]